MRTRPQLVAARVTEDEKTLIIAAAAIQGVPVSEFVLQILVARAESVLNGRGDKTEREPTPPEF